MDAKQLFFSYVRSIARYLDQNRKIIQDSKLYQKIC